MKACDEPSFHSTTMMEPAPCPAFFRSWATRAYPSAVPPEWRRGVLAQRLMLAMPLRSPVRRSRLPSRLVSHVRGAETCGFPNQVSRNERLQSTQLLERPGMTRPPSFWSWDHCWKGSG